MSYLKIQHVFFGLMALSAIMAFAVPPRYARRVVPQVSVLYAPVSRPVAGVASWVSNRVAPPAVADRRAVADIRQENQQLRSEIARLRMQVVELSRRDSELAKLGDIKNICKLAKVIGADGGPRQSILLAASSLQGFKADLYVLHPSGLVGQIQSVSAGGAQVRLITDPGFHIRIQFVRFTNGVAEPLQGIPKVIAQGDGKGTLVVRALSLEQVGYDAQGKELHRKDLEVTRLVDGDYAVVDDPDCPRGLTGVTVGRVSRISYRADARLFADIRIRPNTNLQALPEVMVLMKEQ